MSVVNDDFKPLLIQWVEEEAINATKRGSKMVDLYNKILFQLRGYELPICDLKTLKLIKYVGDKTANQLRKKIAKHCKENELTLPRGFMDVAEKHRLDLEESNFTLSTSTTKTTNKRAKTSSKSKPKYVPKHRSGGFAILIALYIYDKDRNGMTKERIIAGATPYCDRSFSNNAASKEFYSAWSSAKTLENHNLISTTGRSPKIYFLTDEGVSLAQQLKTAIGLSSPPEGSKKDDRNMIMEQSFDNGIRLDTSFELSSPAGRAMLSSSPIRRISNPVHSNRAIQKMLEKELRNGETPPSLQHDAGNRIYDGIKYEVWRKEDYEVIVYMDNREIRSRADRDHFQTRLQTLGVKCEVKPLSSGDVLWVGRNTSTGTEAVLNYLCERKRLDDLCDSIKDGRFQEQKNRMKKTGIKHCYYLVEDMVSYQDKVYDLMDSIQSYLTQTMTTARLYLRRFKDIDETTAFIASNTKVIENLKSNLIVIKPQDIKNQQDYLNILLKFRNKFEKTQPHQDNPDYECVQLFSRFQDMLGKTNQMTVKEMFILMLMTIRGVSLEKAVVIQNRFPTPKSLLEYYHTEHATTDTNIKRDLMMNEFKDQIGNKKIGKALLEKIYNVWGKP